MPKRVIFTEKPDAAMNVATFLGIAERREGYYILKNGDIASNGIGHLLNQGVPEDYMTEAQKNLRGFDQLPMLPSQFRHFPSPDKKKQLNILVKLFKEADIIVNAGDVDREGQYIFNETVAYAGIDPHGRDKPIERVLMTSFTDTALKAAFADVRRNGDPTFVGQGYAGEARAEADWLIGMNGSRATKAAIKGFVEGGVSVGRVQTPTLGLVVARELQIRNFKPVTFYVPQIKLPDGRVLTWKGRIDGADMRGIDEEGRIVDRQVAEAIVARIQAGIAGIVTKFDESKREQDPPLPFSLGTLQSEISAKHGISAKHTKEATQDLYESKKMVSYLGTSCRYLPTAMHQEAPGILEGLSAMYNKAAAGANPAFKYKCWDDSKVTVHYAIIPTGQIRGGLTENQQKIFDTISRRYMAQFYPKHQFKQSVLEARYGEDEFRSSWKETLVNGWKDVDQPADEDEQGNGDDQAAAPKMRMK